MNLPINFWLFIQESIQTDWYFFWMLVDSGLGIGIWKKNQSKETKVHTELHSNSFDKWKIPTVNTYCALLIPKNIADSIDGNGTKINQYKAMQKKFMHCEYAYKSYQEMLLLVETN